MSSANTFSLANAGTVRIGHQSLVSSDQIKKHWASDGQWILLTVILGCIKDVADNSSSSDSFLVIARMRYMIDAICLFCF